MTDPNKTFEDLKTAAQAEPWPDVAARLSWLRNLKDGLVSRRGEIQAAVWSDFRKSPVEADLTEILPVLFEIRTALSQLKSWTAPKKIRASFPFWGLSSRLQYRPKGVVLVISPWNYPFNLSLGPVVSALAAGNRVIVKPSERVSTSSALISEIIHDTLPANVCAVIEGGPEVGDLLLKLPFDHFFFTGGGRVGSMVMHAASDHLSTATLELGGKSPAIVDGTVDLDLCAEKIIRGKYLNAGQTCIAPDYVVAPQEQFDRLVGALLSQAARFEGEAEMASPVDVTHAERLESLLRDAISQGATLRRAADDTNGLTIATGVPLTSRLMQEEIFGPILPVLRYSTLDELHGILSQNPQPLTTYLFSNDRAFVDRFSRMFDTGSLCINETLVHFVHPRLPFGGVGRSGSGRSHGRAGFETFSNAVPIMRQNLNRGFVPLIYPGAGRLQSWARSKLYRFLEG